MTARFVEIFGIRFLDGDVADAMRLLDQGGVMVVPSGPGLATIDTDTDYYRALKESRFALFDSGLLVLLLKTFRGMRVTKLSGLLFLKEFLAAPRSIARGQLFLIDPSEQDSAINRDYLASRNIEVAPSDQYVAPIYGAQVADAELLSRLNARRPSHVLINLGGGVQEKLAHFLARELDYSPGIICTGAAIAFLTGRQAAIPGLADRLGLGWLVRCISAPRRFVPRYLAAFRLVWVFFTHRDTH